MSEGHTSAVRILRTVQPTRHLFDGAKYVPSHETNIARTFRKFELLAKLQAKQS